MKFQVPVYHPYFKFTQTRTSRIEKYSEMLECKVSRRRSDAIGYSFTLRPVMQLNIKQTRTSKTRGIHAIFEEYSINGSGASGKMDQDKAKRIIINKLFSQKNNSAS